MSLRPGLMVRRADTPASQVPSSVASGLPEDLMRDLVRRLELFSAIGVGLWSYGLVLDAMVTPRVFTTVVRHAAVTRVEILGIVTSVLMFLYVRYGTHGPQTKLNVGLAYLLANAVGVATLNSLALRAAQTTPVLFLSWNTVVILVFAMIAIAPPRQLLLATLLAASMDPLVMWFAYLQDAQVPSFSQTMLLYLPNYVCAVVALLPSLILRRLSAKLHHAQELGSYRLVEMLGQGGMGEVWRAEHRLLARNAAVKLVRPDVLGASSTVEATQILGRFEREARATASLRSPHTIQVFDFGTTLEGNFYYVMEMLNGRDLESLVRDFGPVSPYRAIYLMRQVCHSLAEAHARGLVHRDIKPANIYVCRMGLEYDFVKVLDFGLVKIPDRAERRQTLLSADQRTSGTPAYMAPEVILGDADVDRRADVYAAGCVAYYLLTGQLVFEAESSMKMLMQHVSEKPVPPSQRSEMPVPQELDALVLACLEKDPNKRPQNAEELFRMSLSCCSSHEGWGQDAARSWWSTHLPEHCGALTLEPEAPLTVGSSSPASSVHA
jgi:eukaryotic-like serine/threonine-protein kinase